MAIFGYFAHFPSDVCRGVTLIELLDQKPVSWTSLFQNFQNRAARPMHHCTPFKHDYVSMRMCRKNLKFEIGDNGAREEALVLESPPQYRLQTLEIKRSNFVLLRYEDVFLVSISG